MRWLAVNFPPSTLPLFLSLAVVLVAANVLLWRYIFRGRS
jgi:hypothetical protein